MAQSPDVFAVDWSRYRLVDLSYTVIPPGTEERPFVTERSFLADDSFKHDVRTHTHVGTHVEAPAHFFEGGKTVLDLPLEAFMGRAVLLRVTDAAGHIPLTGEGCDNLIGDVIQDGDIVLCTNADLASRTAGAEAWPSLSPASARWFLDHGVKMVGIDNYFRLGLDIPMTRDVHDILMSRDVCFVEFLDHLDALTQPVFCFMALPFKVASDSGWARAVAIEAR
jgi:kynurenine formamidase